MMPEVQQALLAEREKRETQTSTAGSSSTAEREKRDTETSTAGPSSTAGSSLPAAPGAGPAGGGGDGVADSGAPVVTTVTHVQIDADISMASGQELADEQGVGSRQAAEASLNATNVTQNTSFKLTAEEAATLRRTYTIAEFKVLHSSSMGLCDVREYIDTSEEQEHMERLHRVAFRRALLDVQGNTHGAVDDAGQHGVGGGPGAGRGTRANSVAMLGWERAGGVVLPRFHVFMVVSVVSVTPRIRGFGLIKQPEEESFPCRTLA